MPPLFLLKGKVFGLKGLESLSQLFLPTYPELIKAYHALSSVFIDNFRLGRLFHQMQSFVI